jgi:Zn-dependent protease
MFVPGLGAFVRMDQYPQNPREDARVGLAGPIWGLGAALVAYGIHLATGAPIWAAITRTAAFLNLFNLLPVWQLDGGRGYRALSRSQRGMLAGLIFAMWVTTHEGMLVLLLLVAVGRLFGSGAPAEGDTPAFSQFAVLIVALSALCTVPVPGHALP